MSLPIITADQRLAETRGIKGVIFGPSGIGKTCLLWTLEASTTLSREIGGKAIRKNSAQRAGSNPGRHAPGRRRRWRWGRSPYLAAY